MIGITEARLIAKLMVKEQNKLEATHSKNHARRVRIIKRAISLNEKMKVVVSRVFPMQDAKGIDQTCWRMVDWMTDRMEQRTGRMVQIG